LPPASLLSTQENIGGGGNNDVEPSDRLWKENWPAFGDTGPRETRISPLIPPDAILDPEEMRRDEKETTIGKETEQNLKIP